MAGMAGMGAFAGMAGYGAAAMSNYGQYTAASAAAGAYTGAAQAFAAAAGGGTYHHGLPMPTPFYQLPQPPTRKSTTGTFGITTRFMQHKRFGLKKCLSRLCKALTEILNLFTFIDSINLLKSLYCVVTVCSLQGISVGLWSCF